MTQEQLQAEIEEHTKVYERVVKEVEYWLEVNKKDSESNSPCAANSRGIYMVFRLYMTDLETYIKHELGKIEPYEYHVIYKGRKAIRVFIDIINMFEGQLNHLAEISKSFQEKIDSKVKPLIDSVDKNWNEDETKIKDGITKAELIRTLEAKKHETAMRRRALSNLGWITKDEFSLLEFAWWLRNCMHNDFSALSDKEFSFHDIEANETYSISFKKGEIIGLHTHIIYSLSRIIGRILYHIIQQGQVTPDNNK